MYKLAINRPIATLMFVLSLLLFGFWSYQKISSALLPNIEFPLVTVKTIYPGADAKTIESEVTQKIEEAVSSIGGIDNIISTTSDNYSVVTVKFDLKKDIEIAANDVRDKVSSVNLPKDAKKPLVSKLDTAGAPIIKIFFSLNKGSNLKSLMDFVDLKAKPIVERIDGVGNVRVVGFREKEIKIEPKLSQLSKYNLSVANLNSIIAANNIKLSTGKITNSQNEYILKVNADAKNAKELEELIIKPGIKLKDVADVKETLKSPDSYSTYNSNAGITMEVQKVSGTNTLDIIKKIKAKIPKIKEYAKDKYSVKIIQDTSPFIIHSLHDVLFDLIYGAILAVIIVLLFLRKFTLTIVSAISIPVAILGTIALMYIAGFELNKMSLIGLTLAIGIIIDDAIVVLENIAKKIEGGLDKFSASVEGAKEMAFPVVAISSMLLAVFIPVANMSGIVGKFFESFAITVSFAIIISYLVAMSFIPSVSARVLSTKESWFYKVTEPFLYAIDRFYVVILKFLLRFKWITIIVVFAIVIFSLKLFPSIGIDFLPKEDKSEFQVDITAKPGISLESMIKKSQKVDRVINSNKLVDYTTLNVAYTNTKDKNKAQIYVKLVDKSKRKSTQEELINQTREAIKKANFKDLKITVAGIPNVKGVGVSVPYQLIIKGDEYDKLLKAKDNIVAYLSKNRGLIDIDTNLDIPKPQISILIEREAVARYGINAKAIAQEILSAFSDDVATSYITINGKQYDITLKLNRYNTQSIEDIKKLKIKAKNGSLVYLDGLVKFKKDLIQPKIYHYDRQRQITIFADLKGIALGDAVNYTNKKIKELLPDGITYKYSGFAEEMGKTMKAFATAISIAVILMYIILAILYESLIQPIIIMITLPLSITGVLVALYLSHHPFSLFVMIGFMLLMGMVGKNAVLVVNFANEAIQSGKDVTQALIEAGEKRLRPILMTTIAMIFGMIPLAFSHGFGSETKSPMAIAIIGGLIGSMLLTLLVVPIFYRLLYPIDKFLRKLYERKI